MRHAVRVTALLFAASSAGVVAAEPAPAKPTADEVRRTMDYYYRGKSAGPLLVELKACARVDTEASGPGKNDCVDPISAPVKQGTTLQAWVLFFVPAGGNYDDVFLQVSHEGQVRTTHDLKLTQAFRSRTWRPVSLHKPGKWQLRVLRGPKVLGSVDLQVEG